MGALEILFISIVKIRISDSSVLCVHDGAEFCCRSVERCTPSSRKAFAFFVPDCCLNSQLPLYQTRVRYRNHEMDYMKDATVAFGLYANLLQSSGAVGCVNRVVGLVSHSLSHSFPVPNKPYGFCGREARRTVLTELGSCVNREVGLGSYSLSRSSPAPNKSYGFCGRNAP